jgi:hypothetical protein
LVTSSVSLIKEEAVPPSKIFLSKPESGRPESVVDAEAEPGTGSRARGTGRTRRAVGLIAALVVLLVGAVAAFAVTRNSDQSEVDRSGVRSMPLPTPGGDGADTSEATGADASPTPTRGLTAGPDGGADANGAAGAELTSLVAKDSARADELQGVWVPQLASSGPGETSADFLAKYTALSGRYSGVVVIWSGDWPGSFGPSSSNSWVILNAGMTRPTTRPVLDWCAAEGLDPGACWARRLARGGADPSLNTDRYPADDRNN